MATRCAVIGLVLMLFASKLSADDPRRSALPDRFRDLKMYSTSRPDAKNPALVVITTTVRNDGKRSLDLKAMLAPNEQAGFHGSTLQRRLDPGQALDWKYAVRPPDGFRRAVLQGEVSFGGHRDRELFVALQGADPADFDDKRVEKITDKVAVVGTYLPRTPESVRASRLALPRPQPAFALANNGKSAYHIVLAATISIPRKSGQTLEQWAATPNLKPAEVDLLRAIADLHRCVKSQSGAELAVVAATQSGDRTIHLRQDAKHSIRPRWSHPDAFHLHTDAAGNVFVDAEQLDGLRHGIYTLLSDHLDCHWFQPGRVGEEIVHPADRTVRVPKLDVEGSPSFFSATGMSWGYAPHWDRWNRALINRARMTFGHAWANYVSPSAFPYDKHPDMWARDPHGKIRRFDKSWTTTNFCSTSPEVIDTVAKKINEQLSGNPDAIVASIDPNDYAPMCQCKRCRALDRKYGQTKEKAEEVADRLLHFSNEIHKRLDAKNKGKFLGFLVYGYQMELPISARPHAHDAAMICNFPPRYDHTRPWNDPTSAKNRDFYRLVKGWGALLKQFGYYDYYGHYYYFGPWGIIQKIREDLPAFRDLGGTFVMIEAEPVFASQGLNHYIAARLVWDVNADVDLLLDEFYEKYYGPAEAPMRDFWRDAERRFALTRPGTHAERAADDPEFWSELDGLLKKAEQAVAAPDTAQRFQDRVACHRDGFRYGQAMHELMRLAPLSSREAPRTEQQKQAILQALQKHRDALQAIKKKYTAPGDYWPPFVPTYVWLDVDAKIDKLKKTGVFSMYDE